MFDISGWIQSFFGEIIIFWEFPNIPISNNNEISNFEKIANLAICQLFFTNEL